MKNNQDFRIYEQNDNHDYSLAYFKTIKGSFEVGSELDLLEGIIEFIKKHNSKYTDDGEANLYLRQLQKNGYVEFGEYKNDRQYVILKQKGVDFINNSKSIYDK